MREGVEMGQPLRWPWRWKALWLEPPVLGVLSQVEGSLAKEG